MFSWGQSKYKGWQAEGRTVFGYSNYWEISLTDPEGKEYPYTGATNRYKGRTKRAAAKKRIRALKKQNKRNNNKEEGTIIF